MCFEKTVKEKSSSPTTGTARRPRAGARGSPRQDRFRLFRSPETARKYHADDQRVLTTGVSSSMTRKSTPQVTGPIHVEVLKSAVTDQTGNRIGIQGMFWDITDRKNAEVALRPRKRNCRIGKPGEERFPCQRESRNPNSHEWNHRHHRPTPLQLPQPRGPRVSRHDSALR